MINIIMENLNTLLITGDCSILGSKLAEKLKYIYTAIEITVPVLVLLLCTIDLVKAVIAQEEGEMKKAQSRVIKRITIGLAIFFVPLLTDVILDIAGIATGTCGIGGTATVATKDFGTGPAPSFGGVNTLSTSEIQISYSPAQKASGVQIQNLTTGKYVNTTNKSTYTWKDLLDGTKYSFRVRSYYTNSEGKTTYSKWSSEKSATTKEKPKEQLPAIKLRSGSVSGQDIIKIGDSIANGMEKNHFFYSNSKCQSSYSAALKSGRKCSNCALYVSWIMQDAGLIPKGKTFYTYHANLRGNKSIIKDNPKLAVTYTNDTTASLVKSKKLVPGDIIGSKNLRHTMIYRGKSDDGRYEFLSAGTRGYFKAKRVAHTKFSGGHRIGIIIHPR